MAQTLEHKRVGKDDLSFESVFGTAPVEAIDDLSFDSVFGGPQDDLSFEAVFGTPEDATPRPLFADPVFSP